VSAIRAYADHLRMISEVEFVPRSGPAVSRLAPAPR
jgi:hypothetical protein